MPDNPLVAESPYRLLPRATPDIVELARLALVIPAVPLKFVLVSEEMVLFVALMVLFVSVAVFVFASKESVIAGKVRVKSVAVSLGISLSIPEFVSEFSPIFGVRSP